LPARPTPPPTPAVPDIPTFLQKIGRDCPQHAPKFQTWEQLFDLSSDQLKTLGVEPARTRRYIIRWREKYRFTWGAVELKEEKRGRKVDGGERRQKEVRAKRYQEERKQAEGRDR